MDDALKDIQAICGAANSRSQVFRSGSHGHLSCIRHHYTSSAEEASFAVEPGSAEDLSKIMKVIKDRNVPFAVKSGGHATNPTFSSTKGIQISLSRFTEIGFNETNKQLTVGAGCVFDEVYKFIRAKKRNIVGGGGSVGLGGSILGGVYSLKTNQYGLGIDNLVQVEVVIPPKGNEVLLPVKAAKDKNSDLFWAIKGGGNNFGIVTEFVLETHPQGTNGHGYVYGGLLTFDKPRVERVKGAIVNFMKKEDPKAAIVAAFRFYLNQGKKEFKFTVLAFYDDKKPNPDPFKEFLDIPHHGELGESSYTRLDTAAASLYDHIPADIATTILNAPETDGLTDPDSDFAPMSFPRNPSSEIAGIGVMNARARWGNVMVSKYTQKLIDVVEEEAKAAKQLMEKYEGRMVVADIWPFLPTMFDKSVDSAWPHKKGAPNGPLLVYFMWEGKENDKVWIDQMKMALRHIQEIALKEKCTTGDAPVYCNTTLKLPVGDFPSPEECERWHCEQIYRHNLTDLSALRSKYDPGNVMGRTGGFRIPLGHAIVNGTYKFTNTDGNVAIGVNDQGRVVKSTTAGQFKISSTDGTAYIISIDDGSNNRITQDNDGNVIKQESSTTTWKIIPVSRRKNQLEYSIVDQAGKRWVLASNETQVKCINVNDERVPDKALWRFNL